MSLPRGFKANAERQSLQLRSELGLARTDALDLTRLAEHMNVEIVSAGELIDVTRLEELERIQAYSFSAATFKVADRTFVVTSPLRTAARQASDIAHELSHVRLKARAIGDPRNRRRPLPHLPARRGRAGHHLRRHAAAAQGTDGRSGKAGPRPGADSGEIQRNR